MSEDLDVALDLGGDTVAVGVARLHRRRNRITTDFTYDPGYLSNPSAYAIDPALPLDTGRGVVDGLPGSFADSAPDRWGRRLVTKRLEATRREGATPRSISDIDFLLGVSDITRQGALRFRRLGSTEFEGPGVEVPRMLRLGELARAADAAARDDGSDLASVKLLLDAGSGSLGGARPKASVTDGDHLFIAKFPHHADEWDVMAWEKTTLDLAERAGIEVPRRLTTQIDGSTVLLLERFDRSAERRIGYMSAMTLVQGRDGDDDRDYLDLAAELTDVSYAADSDLADLWRRIAFSIAVHNTDDHFRNHGLLRSVGGWQMSPLFDVNPNPDPGAQRVTSISGAASRDDGLDSLMAVARDFGLSPASAAATIRDVNEATRGWRTVASANGVSASAQSRFADAFEGLRPRLDRLSLTP